jgi:hypothetical protein
MKTLKRLSKVLLNQVVECLGHKSDEKIAVFWQILTSSNFTGGAEDG